VYQEQAEPSQLKSDQGQGASALRNPVFFVARMRQGPVCVGASHMTRLTRRRCMGILRTSTCHIHAYIVQRFFVVIVLLVIAGFLVFFLLLRSLVSLLSIVTSHFSYVWIDLIAYFRAMLRLCQCMLYLSLAGHPEVKTPWRTISFTTSQRSVNSAFTSHSLNSTLQPHHQSPPSPHDVALRAT
jgi:hypothetical protein